MAPPSTAGWLALAAGATAAGLVAYACQLRRRTERIEAGLSELESVLVPSKAKMEAIRDELVEEMERGLRGERSSLLMLPSMADFLPTGGEQGSALSIDLGGSNFRVACWRFTDGHGGLGPVLIHEQGIPDAVRVCEAETLFDWMAQAAIDFVRANDIDFGGQLPTVGFCFSFPVQQCAIDSGSLLAWTKGFDVRGSLGADPVALLQAAFVRRGMPAHVAVLMNDTVGVLCAGRYADEDAALGVILGTGFNTCYAEARVGSVRTLPGGGEVPPPGGMMVINVEAGGFDGRSLPRLEEDCWLDSASPNPGAQVCEKMMSGLYLGELVRRLVVRLAERHGLLALGLSGGGSALPDSLLHGYGQLTTPLAARLHGDESPDRASVAAVLAGALGVPPSCLPLDARLAVQRVAHLAAVRSARLLVAHIAAVLRVQGRDAPGAEGRTVVAMDGGMYEKYGRYREMVLEGMALLLGPRLAARVHIRLVPNGSSMGAAAMAAAAVQTRAGQQLAAQAAVAAAGRESADTRGGARSRHRGKRGTRAGQAQPLPA